MKTSSRKKQVSLKEQIQRHVRRWTLRLGLIDWKINLDFTLATDQQALARVTSRHWEYRTATINFCLPSLEGYNVMVIEEVVIHELCHLILHELAQFLPSRGRLSDIADKHEERVVGNLVKAFMQTLYSRSL